MKHLAWIPGIVLLGLVMLACAPQATTPAFNGNAEPLALANLVGPFPRGILERIVTEETNLNPILRDRVRILPTDAVERTLGSTPQNFTAADYTRLETTLGAKLFLSGRVAFGTTTRQAVFRLFRQNGLIGEYGAETNSGILFYRLPVQPEDAREVIRLMLNRLATGLLEAK
jgi:hypothetical protein